MKIKYLYYFITILFFISIFVSFTPQKEIEDDEFKAVYFSYIEFSKYIMDKSDEESKNNIIEIINNLKNNGFNRIIVHVRPFSDSIYKSDIYPVSKYVLNDKKEYPSYDVLGFFIEEAHKNNIKIDAWINPYRISNLSNVEEIRKNIFYSNLLDNNIAKVTENGIYLNPANEKTKELIIRGIEEIVNNYDIDGIHFDDYFYPDKKIDLEDYKKEENISITNFRLNNVKDLIKRVYKSIKKINKNVLFGIAPEGNIDNCYENSYLDIKEILSNNNYIDYIMPQIYYGFNNQNKPFINTVNEWISLIKNNNIKFIPALGLYKSGKYDKYALSGSNEWIDNNNIIKREIEYLKELDNYNGFSLFSYNYLFNEEYNNNNLKKENKNIKDLLTKH